MLQLPHGLDTSTPHTPRQNCTMDLKEVREVKWIRSCSLQRH